MQRILIGIVAGAFAALACIYLFQFVDARLYPLPAGVDPNSASGAANMTEQMATGAKLIVVAGWAIGAFVGGAVAAHLAHRRAAAWFVAAFVVAYAFRTIADILHPGGMVAGGLLLPWAGAYAAQDFARRRPRR